MRLDNWLFDHVFQRFADWFQKLTGKDNFFLARFSIWLAPAAYTVLAATRKGLILTELFMILSATYTTHAINFVETRYKRNSLMRTMNVLRIHPGAVMVRMATNFLLASIYLPLVCRGYLAGDIYGSFSIATMYFGPVSFVYFACCTPLPPGDSTLRKWWNSLAERLSSRSLEPEPT